MTSGWDEAVQCHFESAMMEVDALKAYFDAGDEEVPPDDEWEQLDMVCSKLRSIRRKVGKERGW